MVVKVEEAQSLHRMNGTWKTQAWGVGVKSGPDSPHLVPVCRGNVIVLCPEVGCSHNEIHMEIAVIILL